MERYSVFIKPSAVKEVEAVARKKDRKQVVRRISLLSDDPRPPGCEKLSGQDRFRLRQGPYRIVYEVSDDDRTVLVVKVGHRRDVYR